MTNPSAMEIDVPLDLNKKQENIVLMHSVLTMLNVLDYELDTFGKLLNDKKLLQPTKQYLSVIREHLDSEALTYEHLDEIDELFQLLTENLTMAIEGLPRVMKLPEARVDIENLISVMEHFKKIAGSYMNRKDAPYQWEQVDTETIKAEICAFFNVVTKNCRNRFNVVYKPENQTDCDYLIDMNFPVSSIEMPAIFMDVIIDLLANARKFSSAGTIIKLTLKNHNHQLQLSVEDQGIGIKRTKLKKVVNMFVRKEDHGVVSNVGIGLGLTKAYFITKYLGGKFEITSELGVGTKIDICIPQPEVDF